METRMIDYNKLIDVFGEEKMKDRFKFIYDKMDEYLKVKNCLGKVVINRDSLNQSVLDYFTDIYRVKEFHDIEKVNISKIIGYQAFWLHRRKPLQVIEVESLNKYVFINEGFIMTYIAHELLIPDETIPMSEESQHNFKLFLDHLFYHLKYRTIDKQNLELMLFAFETGKNISK